MQFSLRDFDYELPQSLIADRPLPDRSNSRMMVLHRVNETIHHTLFSEFPAFVQAGDLVVLNDTRVVNARVMSDDGRVELLLLEQLNGKRWRCMVRPGKRMSLGRTVMVAGIKGQVIDVLSTGERIIEFDIVIDRQRVAQIALPPYIKRAADSLDAERYQTVYARRAGAIAAPTAGLHFTEELLQRVPHAFVTLHVGSGTFKPVQSDRIQEHKMHSEEFQITEKTASVINAAQRIIAVGTTTVRVLETCATASGEVMAAEGKTDLFVYPPAEFRVVDALLTNFHLPRSTLLMLVAAFAGREFVLRAYAEAIRHKYRFYSYGDCMLIV
jgi:S-adenosylmethionine:tRNA ribosyltransferase-isomerase